jgi:hypothetical protein
MIKKLKPGQTVPITILMTKATKLTTLEQKLEKLSDFLIDVKGVPSKSASLKQSIELVKQQIGVETKKVNDAINAAKKRNNDVLMQASKKVIDLITTKCSKALATYKSINKVLYRGCDDEKNIFVGRSWENRTPKDSNAYAQKAYDQMLKLHNITALRSNSIFATNRYNVATKYGDLVYIIFPKNGSHFSYSKTEFDIILHMSDVMNEDLVYSIQSYLDNNRKLEIDRVTHYMENDNVKQLIAELKRAGMPGADKLTEFSFADLKKLYRQYQPSQDNFAKALRSGHEILINGEYIAVSCNVAEEFNILDALGIDVQVGR